jgi:hypothetical protein
MDAKKLIFRQKFSKNKIVKPCPKNPIELLTIKIKDTFFKNSLKTA